MYQMSSINQFFFRFAFSDSGGASGGSVRGGGGHRNSSMQVRSSRNGGGGGGNGQDSVEDFDSLLKQMRSGMRK